MEIIAHLPKESGIYLWRNKVNGRGYVGQARNIYKRVREHIYDIDKKPENVLYRAILKHGLNFFEVAVLELCPVEHLHDREIFWISELKTRAPNGYNLTRGGDANPLDNPLSLEKLRATMNKPEMKSAISERIIALNQKPEFKKKRSDALRASWAKDGAKERASAIQRIVQNRPEVKAKATAALRAALNTPEAKAKMSASQIANHARPEVKAKHRAALLIAFNRPEAKANQSAAQKIVQNSPERRMNFANTIIRKKVIIRSASWVQAMSVRI